jgi:hypothetical protein
MSASSTQVQAELDVIGLSAKPAAGTAPVFTGDERLEKLLGINLALATELAVTRERLDTLERLLHNSNLVARESIEGYRPDDVVVAERNTMHENFLARVFRVLR